MMRNILFLSLIILKLLHLSQCCIPFTTDPHLTKYPDEFPYWELPHVKPNQAKDQAIMLIGGILIII